MSTTCRLCNKEITEEHSICEECFNRSDICILCGTQTKNYDLYCDNCQKERDKTWEEMISKIDPKKLEEMRWEEEAQLMMLLDVEMLIGKISEK